LYIANGSTYFGGANNYIAGNLTVAGNATYYNVNSFAVQDPVISLCGGANEVYQVMTAKIEVLHYNTIQRTRFIYGLG
jgi:hypothetical protein